jgi:ABC-type transport system substrate-binding protein
MDRDALNAVMTEGVGTPGLQTVPPGTPLYNDGLPTWTHDVGKARELLAAAGKAGGMTLDCVAQPGTGWDQLGPVWIDQLKQVGITVNVRQISVAESTAAYFTPNTADCFLGGWVGFVSLQGTLYGISHSKSFYTPAAADIGFDGIIAKFNSAYTTEARKAVAREWHQQMVQSPPIALVSNRGKVAVANVDVAGYEHGLLTAEYWRNLHWR